MSSPAPFDVPSFLGIVCHLSRWVESRAHSASGRVRVFEPRRGGAIQWGRHAQGVVARSNVRAKLALTVGRAGPVGENVQRTADRARVARRWCSA